LEIPLATLLPSPEFQVIDANGNPLAAGTIETYIPSTLTPKVTWQDSGQTIQNTNPIVLDAAGRAIIYGSGVYRFIIKDASGNLVYDQLTADTAVGGIAFGGVSTGTPNAQVISASSFSAQDGQVVDFIAGFSNSGAMTVNLGGGAIPLLADTPAGPVPLSGGEVVADNAISMLYEAARGAFHLLTPTIGSMSRQNANNVAITGGTISGVTITASTVTQPTLTLKQATDPAPTAEGDMQWSTLFNTFKVGDGAATQRFWSGPAPGALYGCTIANNVADATNDIDFGSGVAADSTNQFYLVAAALTKRLDATWVVGTNQGGLFSGVAANTTYHCFIIMRPDTGVVDAGFDTSPIAANRPVAYTYYRRVGSIVRLAGAIKAFTQTGDTFLWTGAVRDFNATPSTSGANVTLTVPLGIVVTASLSLSVESGTLAFAFYYFRISPLTETNAAADQTNFTLVLATDSGTATSDSSSANIPTDTSAQIRQRASGAVGTLRVLTNGYVDTRGRIG